MASADTEDIEDLEPDVVPKYKPSPRKSICELKLLDTDDPSLIQYKAKLLG